ncbi:MAG: SAM-dependent methyltransferase [Bacteroidia bacterium]
MSKSYDPLDPYFIRAKKEGYLARSVYKLKEIQEKYRLLATGQSVVDLGAAPGSWSQYVAQQVGSEGKIYAIDLQPLRFSMPQVQFFQVDVFCSQVDLLLEDAVWDGVVSDLGPLTSGAKEVDHLRSVALARRSLSLALKGVRKGGFWVAKVFEGSKFPGLRQEAQKHFRRLSAFRPKATRASSREIYLIGQDKYA